MTDNTLINKPEIRDATIEDLDSLTLLMNELDYPTTTAEMRTRFNTIKDHPDYKTLVITIDDEIVGMAGLHNGIYYEKNGRYLRVVAFVVKQTIRNKGIGKLLLTACENWAIEQGLTSVVLTSGNRDNRKDAHAFYQKMGYEIKSSGFVKQL
jgi:GNAT superfamily N-acetyltransferase